MRTFDDEFFLILEANLWAECEGLEIVKNDK